MNYSKIYTSKMDSHDSTHPELSDCSKLHLEMINSLKDFNKNFVRFHLQKFNSCATGKYNYFYTK